MTEDKCAYCNRPWLGLAGQDYVFDTYFLGKEDGEIFSSSMFGPMHLRCLMESGRAGAWIEKIRNNMVNTRRLEPIYHEDERQVLLNRNARQLVILEDRGFIVHLRLDEVKKMEQKNDILYVPVSSEVNIDIGGALLPQATADELKAKGTLPLPLLLRSAGLYEKLLHPDAVDGGAITYNPKENKGPGYDRRMLFHVRHHVHLNHSYKDIITNI